MPKYTFEAAKPDAILAVLTEFMTIAYMGIAKVMSADVSNKEKLIIDREKARTSRKLFEERVNKLTNLSKQSSYDLGIIFNTCFTYVTHALDQQLDEGMDMPTLYPVIEFLCDSLKETNIRDLYKECSLRNNFFETTDRYTKEFSRSGLKQTNSKLIEAIKNEIIKQKDRFKNRGDNLYQQFLESQDDKTDVTKVGIKPSVKYKVDDIVCRATAARAGDGVPNSPQLSTLGEWKADRFMHSQSPRMWGKTKDRKPPLVKVLGWNILYRFMAVTLVLNDNFSSRIDESLPFLQSTNLGELINTLVGIIETWRKNWRGLDSNVGISRIFNDVYFKLQPESDTSEFWQLMIVLCVQSLENVVSKFKSNYEELNDGRDEHNLIGEFSRRLEELVPNAIFFNSTLLELSKISDSRNNLEEYRSARTLNPKYEFFCDVVQKLIDCNALVYTFDAFVKEHSRKKVADERTPLLGEREASEESAEGCCKCCTIL